MAPIFLPLKLFDQKAIETFDRKYYHKIPFLTIPNLFANPKYS